MKDENKKGENKKEEKKKQIPLRVSDTLWRELASWADDEFRSINGQIEYLLTECVRQRKKKKRAEAENKNNEDLE